MNESFWDAQGVEIEGCAIFEPFAGSGKFWRHGKNMTESILWEWVVVFGSYWVIVLSLNTTLRPQAVS